jgi:starch phosphorylase
MEPTFQVPTLAGTPFRLPPALEGLRRLAYNLYWTWHPRAKVLFSRIDATAWTRYRNPVAVIAGSVSWSELLDNPAFMAEYQSVIREFDAYMADGADHWFQRNHAESLDGPIAYFCAEYGFYESLAIYSGGLGVLAGDHTKSASDMALPFVAVGLLYRKGYFRQTIDADGHQEHAYPDYDLSLMPIQRVQSQDGEPLSVEVELPDRTLTVAVWCVQVGRVPVLLLDTDIPDNDNADRPITHILYVRGREMRLHQELVLGVGGVRAIRALDIFPSAWHLNEGHSAFLLAERARELVAEGDTLDDALEEVRRDSVFTIHTPVSAGNERFDADLVRRVAGPLFEGDGRPGTGGVPIDRLLDIGRGVDGTENQFDMTAFSLRLTNGANAVSQLHAQTANATWSGILSNPIIGITNGVHPPSWLGTPVRELFEHHLEANLDDLDGPDDKSRWWEELDRIPHSEIWEAHQRQKLELAIFARGRLRAQFARHGEAPSVLDELEAALDPNALTIGFARRFATYKRAGLLFSDIDRLARLLWNEERPVQIVFAGKAHPADRPGQQVIQGIFTQSRSPKLRGRVFILEDYDVRIARFLVQGVDIWLNNPRRPMEASGTSGMKAAMNGVVNVSVLDGWWDEGWTGDNGWAIGGRETNPDEGAQDWADAMDLYRILEEEVVPRYYDGRDKSGMPRGWVELMRTSIATTIWRFSTTRMLHEYAERLYLPAAGVEMPAAVEVAAGAEGREIGYREAGALVDGSSDGVADSSAVGASLAGRGRKRPPKRRASAPPVEVVSSVDGATNGELEAEEARQEQAKPLVRRTG